MNVPASRILATIPRDRIGQDWPGVFGQGVNVFNVLHAAEEAGRLVEAGPAEIIAATLGSKYESLPGDDLAEMLAAACSTAVDDPAGFRLAVEVWRDRLLAMSRDFERREIRPSIVRSIAPAEHALRVRLTLALLAARELRS